jgi:hypothetical protein
MVVRRRAVTALVLGVALARTAAGAPATFSGAPMNVFALTGPGTVSWLVGNNTASCDTGPGLGIVDAQFSTPHNDAFDDGLLVFIDGTQFVSPDTVDLTGQTLGAGPVTLSGLDVTVQYSALQDRPALRTVIGLHNPTASPINAVLDVESNFGSDAATVQVDQGSDTNWIITADNAVTPTDAVNTTVFRGPDLGNFDFPLYFPSTTNSVFSCAFNNGFGVSNSVSIPPGNTLNFVYLNELHDTIAAATAGARPTFDATPARTTSFFADLTDDQLVDTANWNFFGQRILNGGNARWIVWNGAGTDTGLVDGSCEYGPGFAVGDATFDPNGVNKGDAFDDGLVFWVGGKIFVAPLTTPAAAGDSVTAGPVSMSGLDVSVTYAALQSGPTLRTIASFTNPTNAPITANVTMNTNVGSDNGTLVQGTSDGDTTVETSDRWVVTSDDATTPSDPVNTHVVAGPGTPVGPPTALLTQGTTCSNTDGIQASFNVTVPAGTTRRLLFFNELHATNADGVTTASAFDTTPATGSALVTGLDAASLSEIVNWAFCANDATICASGDQCIVDACGAQGGCDHTKLPRAASFLSVGCRLADLTGQVGTAVTAGKIQDQLKALLAAATTAEQTAEGQSGKARKKAVAKALKSLKKFARKLKSKAAKKAITPAGLALLKSAAADLMADLKTLKTAP